MLTHHSIFKPVRLLLPLWLVFLCSVQAWLPGTTAQQHQSSREKTCAFSSSSTSSSGTNKNNAKDRMLLSASSSSSTDDTIGIGDGSSFPSTTSTRTDPSTVRATFLNRKPIAGDVVTIDCQLVPEGDFVPEPLFDGVLLRHDEDDEPARLTFVLHGGNYLPGLHDLVADLVPGERVERVSLDAGWGAHNPDLVATLKFADAGMEQARQQIRPGVQLQLQNGLECVVTETTEERFTIDANPPLAGASYAATVELLSVEEGPTLLPYQHHPEETTPASPSTCNNSRYQVITLALGCFWGAELEFMREPGVVGTTVGYTQGQLPHPSYEQVCTGTTGHTEAVAVVYDPEVVSLQHLLHAALDRLGENKYLLNQVGNDQGTQYRHGIYYHTAAQKDVAERVLDHYGEDCVTECLPATEFYPAESYHQQYLLKGGQSSRKNDPSPIRCYG